MAEPGKGSVGRLLLSPAPHLNTALSTPGMAWLVVAALLPAAAWGIVLFGASAARACGVALAAAVAAEALTTLPFRRFTLGDGSATLTGLLVGMWMPAGAPLYVPAAASIFAIVVVKQTFGGLGRNWMNPAAGGVLFALISWSASMAAWLPLPAGASVPPLVALGRAYAAGGASGAPLAALAGAGYPFSPVDSAVTGWINGHLLGVFHLALPRGSFDVLVGYAVGPVGTVSPPLLLAGAGVLMARRVIRWDIPVAYLVVFAALVLFLGGPANGQRMLAGGPLFHVLSGSLLLGAFFVSTDPVTSPLSRGGRWAYGALLGGLTFLLRFFGTLGDGVAVSIALGNALVPLIDMAGVRRLHPAAGEGR